MATVVLDASVAVKWFLQDEPDAEQALALRTRLVEGLIEASVPAHFSIEVAGALVRAVRRNRFDAAALGIAMRKLGDLPIVGVAMGLLEDEAAELAAREGLHPMDSAYLVLAGKLGGPLISADRRLIEVGRSLHRDVVWLGDLPAWAS